MPNMKSLFVAVFFILCNLLHAAIAEQTLPQPAYTENLSQWKDKKNYNINSEKLLACWLYIRQENLKGMESRFQEHQWLHLMKECMKKISRKDSVLKITQLAKRNMTPVTPFTLIMDINEKLKVEIDASQTTQFDKYLLQKSQVFSKELSELLEKGDIDGQIEEELKKRQKYYFGIIPASMVNHTTILIAITMLMMFCCTCFKFFRTKTDRPNNKKGRVNVFDTQQESMISSRGTKAGRMKKR